MKVIYIAHPISGDVAGNLKKIIRISRKINLKEPNVVPFAPYYLDCLSLNDNSIKERERGIRNDHFLIKKGFIDEIRLYGNRISKGMREEVRIGRELGIIIIPMNSIIKKQLSMFLDILGSICSTIDDKK